MSGRVVYKVSGESLAGHSGGAGDATSIERFRFVAAEIAAIADGSTDVSVVVGGGNLFRGADEALWSMTRLEADEIGMYATGLNAQFLACELRDHDRRARVYSRGKAESAGEKFNLAAIEDWLDQGGVSVIAGGVALPFVSSDYASVHHAIEIGAECVLVAKYGVKGVYDRDPNADPRARFLREVSCSTVIRNGIEVMDFGAVDLARRFGIRIHVFAADLKGAALQALKGEPVGSVIEPR